jgi:hypothetical protein
MIRSHVRPLRTALALAVTSGLLAVALLIPAAASAKNCGDQYGQLLRGPSGILILKHRGVSCATIRTIGYALLNGRSKLPGRIDGLSCVYVNYPAAGGRAKCTRGQMLATYAFE